jgi:hypothetical protein
MLEYAYVRVNEHIDFDRPSGEEAMELPGSAYLYTLAALSMTFAGFCAVVIVIRQTMGRELSGFHVVLMRLYIESGLAAAAFCMLPGLLAVCGFSPATTWRAASAIIAIAMIFYGATYPVRRQAVMAGSVPTARWLPIVAVSLLVIAALIGNAAGIPREPAAGPVAVAASWTLACGAIVFILALNAFWERGERP